MSVERSITVELGYEGTDFKRRYKISGVSEAAFNNLKDKILAFNDNVPEEAKTVFVSDDGEGEMKGIAAALWSLVEDEAINLEFTPEILSVSVDPPTLSVTQGQSAVAIVSASGNEDVTSIIYTLSGAPSWMSVTDDSINVAPSENDLGTAVVTVIAADTGSDAQASTEFVAEAKIQPVISSVAVSPATVASFTTATMPETATITAVANEGVQSLTYELENAPDWVTNDGNIIYVAPRSSAATATVTAIAKDADNSVLASTTFVAMVENPVKITAVTQTAEGWPVNSTDTIDVYRGGSRAISLKASGSGGTNVTTRYEVETNCDWITATNVDSPWCGEIHLTPAESIATGNYPLTVKANVCSKFNPNNSFVFEKPLQIQVATSGTGTIPIAKVAARPNPLPAGQSRLLFDATIQSSNFVVKRLNRMEIVDGVMITPLEPTIWNSQMNAHMASNGGLDSLTYDYKYDIPPQYKYSSFSTKVKFIFNDGCKTSRLDGVTYTFNR